MAHTIAVYAGSFDPITNGHLDIIERSCRTFDEVCVVVAHNVKKTTLFDLQERRDMAVNAIAHLTNARAYVHAGLVVDFCKTHNATVLVRGLRAVTDFEYELGLSHINHDLDRTIDTVFFPTHPENSFISSSMVRELAGFNRDITKYVPGFVAAELIKKFSKSG